MATEFTMPKLGLTMEEGTILQWLVADGDEVRPGTAVMVVETDKVETEVEIPEGGRLHVLGEVGSTYRCGERIGWLLAAGEAAPAGGGAGGGSALSGAVAVVPAGAAASVMPTPVGANNAAADGAVAPAALGQGGRLLASPFARRRASELRVDINLITGSGPGGRIVSEDVEGAAAATGTASSVDSAPHALATTTAGSASKGATSSGATASAASTTGVRRPVAAPATYPAAELARLVGIDLATTPIVATSPDGRISREDVADHIRRLLSNAGTAITTPSAPAFAPLTQQPASTIPLKGMRGTIATRMRASLQDMAQLTLMMDVEMDAVVAHRNAHKAAGSPVVPGYTDYVMAAAARALQTHPRVNSQVTADGIALLPQVNVGIAVALAEGLVVPVVHDADQLPLLQLAAETTRLAEAAKTGSLKLPELEGGTFSVTALGMFGVDGFTPVINPPNAAILGVGRLRDDVAWTADGAIRRVRRLTLSLTWDHRVLDGAPAAEFVRTIAQLLDDPTTLG